MPRRHGMIDNRENGDTRNFVGLRWSLGGRHGILKTNVRATPAELLSLNTQLSMRRKLPPTIKKQAQDHRRQKYYADHLVHSTLESVDILATDPIVVHALYARRAKKGTRQKHVPKTVAPDFEPDQSIANRIYDLFENQKDRWTYSATESIAQVIMAEYPDTFPERTRAALNWELFAYRQVIDTRSAVRLRVINMDGHLQFAVVAQRDIDPLEELWDLMGIMPIDSNGQHTKVSEMAPEGGGARPLIGPIRFANHQCRSFNCEFVTVLGTNNFVVIAKATRAISAGDELFIDYGEDYFEDLEEGCPCADPVCVRRRQEIKAKAMSHTEGTQDHPIIDGMLG
ncbi:hypothetical protein PLICRDRAFT_527696 [Plicaturopsis crispa FD-325 SS-3]|uniref:SET domain-containing protein n=1 Tax=Plicaturopsis crispa FD-325 SS-3 TaxID=944288 RepID=A0A0C9SPR0_PLICR|nr:hypothetical protein PLICRDRAFT_527696 [Plicaturopsis crispa FD-325 SS-3]